MRYVVFNPSVKAAMVAYKGGFTAKLQSRHMDYDPVQIAGNLWVIPEAVLQDTRFADLDLSGELTRRAGKVTIREILPEEILL